MQKKRIEGLSDLVFGLALSIGSLAMINQNIDDTYDVFSGIAWFIFGFFVIVNVWVLYTNIMAERDVESELDFRLNLILLMLVSIEPYLLYLLGKQDENIMDFSSTAYAIDIGLILLVLGLFHHKKIGSERATGKERKDRAIRNSLIIVSAFFLISALPFFWDYEVFGMKARFFVWALALIPSVTFKHILPRIRIKDP